MKDLSANWPSTLITWFTISPDLIYTNINRYSTSWQWITTIVKSQLHITWFLSLRPHNFHQSREGLAERDNIKYKDSALLRYWSAVIRSTSVAMWQFPTSCIVCLSFYVIHQRIPSQLCWCYLYCLYGNSGGSQSQ